MELPGSSGYRLATDAFKDRSVFHVCDRQGLEHLGAFAGAEVGNTDGVWLNHAAAKAFPRGVFYAVHDDMAVGGSTGGALPGRCHCAENVRIERLPGVALARSQPTRATIRALIAV